MPDQLRVVIPFEATSASAAVSLTEGLMVRTLQLETTDTDGPDAHLKLIVRIELVVALASETLTRPCARLLAGKSADWATPWKHVHDTVVEAVGPTMTAAGEHEITGSRVGTKTMGGVGGGSGAVGAV